MKKALLLALLASCTLNLISAGDPFSKRSVKSAKSANITKLNPLRIDGRLSQRQNQFHSLSFQKPELKNSERPAIVKSQDGVPYFIEKKSKKTYLYKTFSAGSARQAVSEYLGELRDILKLSDPAEEFVVKRVETDELGQSHIRMEQVHKGVPVYNAEIIVHSNGTHFTALNGRYLLTGNISLTPKIDILQATELVKQDFQKLGQWRELTELELSIVKSRLESRLVIYNESLVPGKEQLVYHVRIRPNFIDFYDCFVDALTGTIIKKVNRTCHATSTGNDLNGVSRTVNTYQSGGTYYMIDASRTMFNSGQSSMPNDPVGAIWTLDANNSPGLSVNQVTSTSNSFNSKAISAHYNAGVAYDYFKNSHGRNSINGQGGTIISIINVTENNYSQMDNAYWNGEAMFYGNGKLAFKPLAGGLDVAGHEMTHGVVQNSADLEYTGQSGAINESMADIFGSMMDASDWKIGEDVVKTAYFPSGALRDLSDPHNGGSSLSDNGYQPRTMSEYYSGSQDNYGVHINSGIPNYAFYKYANASSRTTAAQVFYRALTVYLTKKSQFLDLRFAVVKAATDLYGSSSSEVSAAKTAFDQVGIYDPNPGSGSGNTNTGYTDLPVNPGQDYILSYDVNTFNPDKLYISSTTGTNFIPVSERFLKHKASVTDDGSFAVFIGTDSRMYRVNLSSPYTETAIQTDPIWDNVAISKDGKRLAATTNSIDTSIYIYDFTKQEWSQFKLYNPTYSGVEAGGVLFADALDWDHSGQYVLYDAKNLIKSNFGDDIEYYDIGLLNVWNLTNNNWADGKIEKLYNQLPEDVSIGNPVFSKNSPNIIAFDYVDLYYDEYAVLAKNISSGAEGLIYQNVMLGFPDYSKLDNKIILNTYDFNDVEVIASVPLKSNKIEASASSSILIEPDAKWGVWFSKGTRSLLGSAKDILSFSFPSLSPQVTGVISGTTITLTVPSNTDVTQLTPVFTHSPGSLVYIGSVQQNSGVNEVNFSSAVYYKVVAQDGSSKTYTVIVNKASSTPDLKVSEFVLYPNPATDDVILSSAKSLNAATIKVYDISGREMKTELVYLDESRFRILSSGLSPGVYFVQVQRGSALETLKLIKH